MLSFCIWDAGRPESSANVVFVKNNDYGDYLEFLDLELIEEPKYAFRMPDDMVEAFGFILLFFEKSFAIKLENSEEFIEKINFTHLYKDEGLSEVLKFINELDCFCDTIRGEKLVDSIVSRSRLSDFSKKWWNLKSLHVQKSKLFPPIHQNRSNNRKISKVFDNVEVFHECLSLLSEDDPKTGSVILSAYFYAAGEFALSENRTMSALIYFHRSLDHALIARCIENRLASKGAGADADRILYTYANYTRRRVSVKTSFELLEVASKLLPTPSERILVSKLNKSRNESSMTHSIFCPKVSEVESIKKELYNLTKIVLASFPVWSKYLSAFLFKYEVSYDQVFDIYPNFDENMVQIFPL